MAFLNSFITTLTEAVVLFAVAVGGVFFGKYLRKRKDMKTAGQEEAK